MIETLVAVMIISISMVGAIGIFFSALTINNWTAQRSVAASLAREAIEQAKSQGFYWCTTPQTGVGCDGTVTTYFDKNGSLLGSSAGARYTVVMTVSSSSLTNGIPDNSALRTVSVSVTRTIDNAALESSQTYLTWGGV